MNEPVDWAARQHAVVAQGSVLVQAPAGSGKTTLLAQRYLRLLAEVDAPERILALTFTRRAAQEMRERVMQALEAAAIDCPAGMNRQTWELGRAARRHMESQGQDLESHPSRLRIETIDSFNAWLAGQLAITAGAGARLSLIENARPLYEEAARRTLAHEADRFAAAVDRVLALDDQRWQSLVAMIADMLPSRDRWLPLLAGPLNAMSALDDTQLRRVRRQLDEDLELLVARSLAAAVETIGAEKLAVLSDLMHGAAKRVANPSTPLGAWRANGAPLEAHTRDIARWRGVVDVLLTKEGTLRRQLTKNEGFPPQCADKAAMLDLIAELGRGSALRALNEIRALPDPGYDDAQWERVREVAQVLVLAAAQLDQVFRDHGAVDFPAVSLAALRALGSADAPTDLNLRLDYRLQHILVDEFQDTSGMQLELVKRLTAGWQRGDGRSIFCVGDPMQSIYGFREAEVRAFLELADLGIGEVRFDLQRLRSNFRSAKPVVDWIDACFARILPRVDDRERGAIAFRPSESALVSSEESGVCLRAFGGRSAEAEVIAELIAARMQRHPQWRIGILVRARAHAREVAMSLRARGIVFRAVDIEPLDNRPAVRDVVTLACALLHLGDRSAWLALLRAPWCGLELQDLLLIARADRVIWNALRNDEVVAGLSEEGRHRCERLRRILESTMRIRAEGTVTRWVEQAWLALGGPAVAGAAELEHVAAALARLQEIEARGIPDAAEFAGCFNDLYVQDRAAAAVEIMTIHKAKGLEFDMVFVPALDRSIPHGHDQLLLSHEFARAGRDGLVMAARPGVGGEADRLFDFLRHQARAAASLEAERLLYVACTRAKWWLHLSATTADTDAEPAGNARWQPRAGSLLAVLWPTVGAQFAFETAEGPRIDGLGAQFAFEAAEGPRVDGVGAQFAVEPPASARIEAGNPPRGGPLYRLPAQELPVCELPESGEEIVTAVRAETPIFDWVGETARRVGSLVHAELQCLDLERHDLAALSARASHYRRWLSLHGVPAERLEEAGARVLSALTAIVGDARGRWILGSGYRDDMREHALTGMVHGQLVRVVFDRSFIDQGVRWIIDYKTSHHGGGDLAEFLDREVERYTAQLQRYAQLARNLGPEPIRVGLYFPLLRAWREWEP